MKPPNFSIKQRIKSFTHAFNGLRIVFSEEHNAKIHLFAAVIAVILGFILGITSMEWVVIVFAITLVISMEIINSSIENIADFISPERNEMIKKIKDLSAAAVLVSAMAALIVGLIIFLPKIFVFF